MGREDRKGKRKLREQFTKRRIPSLGYYYIVTDADETEKNYLEGLRDSIPKELNGKIVIKVAKSRTVDLIDKCKSEAALNPQYSEPWIVFDRDQVKDFDGIIQRAQNEGIHVGWSNPCVEIWFNAYFGNMPNYTDSVTCCNEFEKVFKKKTGQKYEKSSKDIYKKLNEHGNQDAAIKIAKRKRMELKEKGLTKPSKMIPCTTVDILVNEIMSKVRK